MANIVSGVIFLWLYFKVACYKHLKAVLLESVPTEISNPNPTHPSTYSFRSVKPFYCNLKQPKQTNTDQCRPRQTKNFQNPNFSKFSKFSKIFQKFPKKILSFPNVLKLTKSFQIFKIFRPTQINVNQGRPNF